MTDGDIKKQLQAKRSELKADFKRHHDGVKKIDNLIAKLRAEQVRHQQDLLRIQGAYKLIEEVLGEEEQSDVNDQKHATTDIQS